MIPYTHQGRRKARRRWPRERWPQLLATIALIAGCAAAWYYHRIGLTLSHYDAKAHLVVARRVIDSLTPGWRQMGAVWLPLPHLLNLFPVQVDAFYRTGASAVIISVLSFGLAVYALSRAILRATGSTLAATAGCVVLLLNPDVLYLQATPMSEPLLFGLTLLAVVLAMEWVQANKDSDSEVPPRAAGWALAGACLTRYEAWPITAAILATAAFALWRQRRSLISTIRLTGHLAAYPAVAILAFLVESRLTVGAWFVTGGFYIPDNRDTGHAVGSAISVWWGTHVITGYGVLMAGTVGTLAALAAGLVRRSRAPMLVLLAPVAAAALPWYAFLQGHPFRIRYMVPLVVSVAMGAGLAVGLTRRLRLAAAAIVIGLVLVETHPFDHQAPMVVEAQLDREHSIERRSVSARLAREYHGELMMASMASLAHYMQELSADGFQVRDFLHEGNGAIWTAALADPRPHVGWILVEEMAEGGDLLARRAAVTPTFLDGFERVASGGGVALYKRTDAKQR